MFDYSRNSAVAPAQPIPPLIASLVGRMTGAGVYTAQAPPDQVTVNVYAAGQGIPPHVDTHSAFEESVCSLSLLSDVVMDFRDCGGASMGVLLPARSLMVMRGAARYRFRHG